MKYPDGEIVTTTYDNNMLPKTMIGTAAYVSNMNYDSAGRMTSRALGNGLTQTYEYYPWTQQGGRLQTLATGTLQNLTYIYDAVGNITSIADSVNSIDQSFGYDALDRLISASATGDPGQGAYSETYQYDPATGNLRIKGDLTLDYLDTNHVHAVTRASNQSSVNSYQYDQNGNQTTRHIGSDTFTLLYDAENRLVEVKKNNVTTAQFTFDGDGKRVKSVIGTETILFAGGHYEKKGSTITKYYFAGASRIAMRKYTIPQNMTVEYFLGDHLGSTSITTDAAGAKISEMRYKPWGELRYSWTDAPVNTTPTYEFTKHQFTGQYSYTAEFGLHFYGARFYDSGAGRFVSPDSIIPEGQGTQAYDRFAYTSNNPLRYTDPTGHRNCEEDGYDCENEKEEEIVYPEIVGTDWTTEEITAIYVAWLLLVSEFGSQAALLEALGGPISFVHTPTGLLDAVAVANEPLNMVFVDSEVFAAQGDYMTWYALHEVGHIFDANNSGGNPALYKSNSFVQAYIPGGCNLNWHGCTGSQWNPTDLGTTKYGLSDGSQEDFADSFASTILYNAYVPKNMTFMNVSPDRMTIINTWISVFVQ